jgi:hypothetical protein
VAHRLEHLAQVPSADRRNAAAVGALELCTRHRIVDILTARKLVRNRTHVAAALHVVLPAQRIESRSVPAHVPGEKRQIDDRQHVVDGVVVFGNAERPADFGAIRARVRVREFADPFGTNAGHFRRERQRVRLH